MIYQRIDVNRYLVTPLTRVRRLPKLASYDVQTVRNVLDAAYVCHIAFTIDEQPHCIPTAYWRIDDTLYIHGSFGSRLLCALSKGISVAVEVTLLDGLVFARSAFNHTMNYRSVVIYGRFFPIEGREQKTEALRAFMEQLAPGRWNSVRQPTDRELNATALLAIPIVEAVAKISSGPPKDDEADLSLPVWAGVVPITHGFGKPQTAPDTTTSIDYPYTTLSPSAIVHQGYIQQQGGYV